MRVETGLINKSTWMVEHEHVYYKIGLGTGNKAFKKRDALMYVGYIN